MSVKDGQAFAYILHNPETDETYVGSTSDENRRRRDHFQKLRSGRHENPQLQAAFDQNQNFDFVSIPLESRDEAFDFEQTVIDDFVGSPLLLNVRTNVRTGARELSDEAKEKIRQANLNRSDDVKQRFQMSQLGRTQSPEERERHRLGNLGKKRAPEVCRAIGERSSIPISVNGVVYPSLTAAGQALGINKQTIQARLDNHNGRFDDWFRITDRPQEN